MAHILIDFTGVDLDRDDFEPIPPGVYPARIDAEKADLSEDGAYFTLKFVLEHPDYQGRHVYQRYWVKGEEWQVRPLGRMLRNLGIDISKPNTPFNTDALHGRPVAIKVVQNPGKGQNAGKIYNNVEEVLPRNPSPVAEAVSHIPQEW